MNMLTMKNYLSLVVLLFALAATAQDNRSALIPMPNHFEQTPGKPFRLGTKEAVIFAPQLAAQFAGNTLRQILKERMRVDAPVVDAASERAAIIQLTIDPELQGGEHYTLKVNEKGMTLTGATAAALYYGVMTVDQLLLGDVCSTQQRLIAPVTIDDSPRFAYRALMLDPARNFLPVEDVKFYIDQMARYKYNVLQLHLTDDQGWRIEIKKHPRLTTGSGFYTQEQLKDIIRYAAERHIDRKSVV